MGNQIGKLWIKFPRTKVPRRECERVYGKMNQKKTSLDLWKSENSQQTDLGNFTALKAFKKGFVCSATIWKCKDQGHQKLYLSF
jgi:hypothetical protein